MTWWAIGNPGQGARLLLSPCAEDRALEQAGAAEVAVPVPGIGEYVIAADGLSAALRTFTEEETRAEDLLQIRSERNLRLASSDKYVLPDFPISEDLRQGWLAYRQALRELPASQPGATPETVEWPSEPEI